MPSFRFIIFLFLLMTSASKGNSCLVRPHYSSQQEALEYFVDAKKNYDFKEYKKAKVLFKKAVSKCSKKEFHTPLESDDYGECYEKDPVKLHALFYLSMMS